MTLFRDSFQGQRGATLPPHKPEAVAKVRIIPERAIYWAWKAFSLDMASGWLDVNDSTCGNFTGWLLYRVSIAPKQDTP